MGARVVEKHFTLNNSLKGPDHYFSMNPNTWSEMILRARELERCLGSGIKKVENNEKDTVIIQRRSIHARNNIPINKKITKSDLIVLRPSPKNSFKPDELKKVIGKKTLKFISRGQTIFKNDIK